MRPFSTWRIVILQRPLQLPEGANSRVGQHRKATGKPRVGGFSQTGEWMRRFSGPVLAGLLVAVVSLPVAPDSGVPLRDKYIDQSDRPV